MSMALASVGLGLTLTPSAGVGATASIQLSATSFAAAAGQGSVIGALSVLGGSGTYTFTLTDSSGSQFQAGGNNGASLQAGSVSASVGPYSVTVHADNGAGSVIDSIIALTAVAAASRFWVGGTGDWDAATTTHWAATSNGTGGASVPGPYDNVTFDASSGGGTVTVTVDQAVGSITMGAFTGTLSATGKTINAKSISGTGTGTRTLDITNSTINLTGGATTSWNFGTVTNLTLTATGSTINLTGANATFSGGGKAYGSVTLSGGSVFGPNTAVGTLFRGSNSFVNLSLLGTSSGTDQYTNGGGTQTISGLFTAAGYSAIKRLWISSDVIGTNRTFSAAAISLANVDFSNTTAAGAASPFTGTSLGDFKGNSNITTTTPKTVYWVGGTGSWSEAASHWAASSGGAPGMANFPLPQDTVTFDASSFPTAGLTITQDLPRYGTIDFTGAANNPVFATPIFSSYYVGDLKLISGMTCTGSVQHNWYLQGGATATYTSAGVRIIGDIQLLCAPTGVLQLGDDADINENLLITQGTFTAANHNLLLGTAFVSNSAQTRTVNMGSGTWTFRGTSATIWDSTTAGITINASTSTIKLACPTTINTTRIFKGGGLTFANFLWADTGGGTGGVTFTGANIFTSFVVNSMTGARALIFPASTTTTATSFAITGNVAAKPTIKSSSNGVAATLSDASGTNTWTDTILQDLTATGGATWNATASNDNGGNTGISIAA